MSEPFPLGGSRAKEEDIVVRFGTLLSVQRATQKGATMSYQYYTPFERGKIEALHRNGEADI